MTISLAFLAPDLVTAAIAGRLPDGMEWPASPTCPPSGLASTRCSDFLRRNPHSNRVSASRGLRFRETEFRGQKKTRRSNRLPVTAWSLRNEPSHRSPPIRGLW
jgi:hypothetical protein